MASAPPDFDAVMERALAVGVLTTPAYDRLTDEIARGDRTGAPSRHTPRSWKRLRDLRRVARERGRRVTTVTVAA